MGGLGLVADVADYPAVQAAARRVHGERGGVDHVVFAVGIGSGKFGFPFWNLTPADWPRSVRGERHRAANTSPMLHPALIEKRSGSVLFLSSVAGQIGSQTDPPYSASKAALINFAQCAAKDLAPYSVRVNTVYPGMVQTALNRSVWQAWDDQQPPGQAIDVRGVGGEKVGKWCRWAAGRRPRMAAMAVFLASARAANVTGQTMNVDGGSSCTGERRGDRMARRREPARKRRTREHVIADLSVHHVEGFVLGSRKK